MNMTGRKRTTLLLIVVILSAGCFVGEPFASQSSDDGPRFREVGSEQGFNYTASHTATFGNGRAGVYVADFNNDRYPDILAIGGEGPALFENTGGAFKRVDVLPPFDKTVKGALFIDYDNDGWEDLLLLPINGSAIFLQNHNGSFHRRDIGFNADLHIAIGASAADYDRDGCLDVFVIQSGDWRKGVPKAAMLSHSRDDVIQADNGNPNLLFEGDCESFKQVEDIGIKGTRWSLTTSFVDLTGDGYPDIHVGNDFNTDILYVNQQDGTFRRKELPDTDRHAMASEVADVNGDGRLDVFVTNIHFDRRIRMQRDLPSMGNTGNNLLINQGNGTFTTKERSYGVRDGGWGWAAALVDLDNDGDRDLVHATKNHLSESRGGKGIRDVLTRPRIWERTEQNFTRLNASEVGFETSSGRGLVHLDYDRDGDQDLAVANHNGEFKLYENLLAGGSGNWLQIELSGDKNPVIGSRVYVTTRNGTQHRVMNARADFLSQDTRTLHFGLGSDETVTVRVVWPDGTERTIEEATTNRRLLIPHDGPIESVAGR